MVSAKKKLDLKNLVEEIDKYPVVGLLDMHKLPAKQLHQIKEQLRGRAVIKMVKKRVIMRALEASKKEDISKLEEKIQNQPAMLFSEGNPFELAQLIARSKTKAPAKAGDIAPYEIVVSAGPTSLPPGPAIGELQRAKIKAGVEGDKIVVKEDSVVAKEGDVIDANLADLLSKLDIEPMEISLNLLAIWDEGMVFGKDILFIPKEHYIGQLQSGYASAFNLAINIGHLTKDTVPGLLVKAHQEAKALVSEAGIITKETVGIVLAKASAQADALKVHVKEKPTEEAAEEKEKEAAAEAKEEVEKKKEEVEPAPEQPEEVQKKEGKE
ncbi:MAG: 50S ribosomal protein L10 [Candidatus Aenigmatarchaeota archaeon]|nr:MAG: 50S ribosomal protein L10 [Candidatus Aenigmarchaeota archaeon]